MRTFTALRSSLSNAHGRTRLFYRDPLAVHVPMAGRMQQHPIVSMVAPAQRSLHEVFCLIIRDEGIGGCSLVCVLLLPLCFDSAPLLHPDGE